MNGAKTFKAIVLTCDIPTRSGNIYPKAVIEAAIAKSRLESPKLITMGEACISNVAAIVREIAIEKDDTVVVEAVILDTPKGQDLSILINSGMQLLPYGEVKTSSTKNGLTVIEDYTLRGFSVGPRGNE
jgi:hypothetical protein